MNTILTGDCLSVMPTLPENSVDSVICDPPYGLDFMGKSWDHGVPGMEFWQAALRVAKPGAILMAFGGTRTYHRLTCVIEDAGWEIRDGMCWLYGSGFPKSLDISKAIDKAERGVPQGGSDPTSVNHGKYKGGCSPDNPSGRGFGAGPSAFMAERGEQTDRKLVESAQTWQGWGTALKPAWEPIIVAMKPLQGTYAENAQKWGVAGLNIDGARIGTEEVSTHSRGSNQAFPKRPGETTVEESGRVARQDLVDMTPHTGRWPANLLLDEEAARLLDEQSGMSHGAGPRDHSDERAGFIAPRCSKRDDLWRGINDYGGASRFFYTAKASSSERNAGLENGNNHPTIKPVSLMRYLCKLTRTPTGGVVLDPFMGSGTTGVACILEHRDFIGIEIDPGYAEIARKRIDDMTGPLFVPPEVKHGESYLYN